jgi:hypothetical protein
VDNSYFQENPAPFKARGYSDKYDGASDKATYLLQSRRQSESAIPSSSEATSDLEAANKAIQRFRQGRGNEERKAAESMLRDLLDKPKLKVSELEDILWLCSQIFFDNSLSKKYNVYGWSRHDDPRFVDPITGLVTPLVGTTDFIPRPELRSDGSYRCRTRITLSVPRLQTEEHDQRLAISAVIHESIHAYLFSLRGNAAREGSCEGHSPGFQRLAAFIEEWIGTREFRLWDTKADLAEFEAVDGGGWDEEAKCWRRNRNLTPNSQTLLYEEPTNYDYAGHDIEGCNYLSGGTYGQYVPVPEIWDMTIPLISTDNEYDYGGANRNGNGHWANSEYNTGLENVDNTHLPAKQWQRF